jgi:hypothetical protein
MRRRKSSAHWLWRDLRLSYLLLFWGAVSFGLIVYFAPAATLPRNATLPPPSDDDRLITASTASIILVPPRGERCWQRILDNRTGRMWDRGYVNCYQAITQPAEPKPGMAVSSVRLNAISNAFRHDDN